MKGNDLIFCGAGKDYMHNNMHINLTELLSFALMYTTIQNQCNLLHEATGISDSTLLCAKGSFVKQFIYFLSNLGVTTFIA